MSNLKSVTLIAFEQLAFNAPRYIVFRGNVTPKYRGNVTLGTPTFRKFFKGSCPNYPSLPGKSVSLTILEQLAFNPPQFRRSCVPGHALFSENIREVMSGISLGTCLSNMKSVTVG